MAPNVRGILFDLGETLLLFGKVDVRALFEQGARQAYDYLARLGLPLPPFAKYHRRHLWSVWWHSLKSRITRREFNSLALMRRHCRRMKLDLTDEQMLELVWLWYEPLSRCATLGKGTKEALQALTDRGLTLGLVSNTFFPRQTLDRHLERIGLLDLLPVRVYSSEVGYRKPNRRIFRTALSRSGLPAEETMFVGDTPKADVDGANRAGLISVLKETPHVRLDCAGRPQHRIRRIADLVDLVDAFRTEPGGKPPEQA